MNLARVSAHGQITVPAEVRKSLGLKPGDKILFTENDRGETVICNTSAAALKRAQKAFRGVAAEMGLRNDDDVQALIDEVRHDAGH